MSIVEVNSLDEDEPWEEVIASVGQYSRDSAAGAGSQGEVAWDATIAKGLLARMIGPEGQMLEPYKCIYCVLTAHSPMPGNLLRERKYKDELLMRSKNHTSEACVEQLGKGERVISVKTLAVRHMKAYLPSNGGRVHEVVQSNKSGIKCYHCLGYGHISKECPKKVAKTGAGSGAGGAVERRRCHRCHEAGHLIANCPKPTDKICHNCNEPGHLRANCPSAGPPRVGPPRRCYECQGLGHIARDCPKRVESTSAAGAGGTVSEVSMELQEVSTNQVGGGRESVNAVRELTEDESKLMQGGVEFITYGAQLLQTGIFSQFEEGHVSL